MNIIVIGAGLAGAACASALAHRGCKVTVLEANSAPKPGVDCAPACSDSRSGALSDTLSGAPSSGLPVALMAPHYSKDDNAISQLSRLGLDATLHAARNLLIQGQDWSPCGALQRAGKLGPQARWFGEAAWVKPAALVAAWLTHPHITLHMGAQVHSVQQLKPTGQAKEIAYGATQITSSAPAAGRWQVSNAQGTALAQADAVVLANAYQAGDLLRQMHSNSQPLSAKPVLPTLSALVRAADALHAVAGQVIFGPWTTDWQALWPHLMPELAAHNPASTHTNPCAINGNGHFIPALPWQGGLFWLSGSTYEHDTPHNPQVTPQGINANLQRLQQLIPAAKNLLTAQHNAGLVQAWAGARCTTRDRLPLVGAVSPLEAPGLYACTAMGSRGLSFAALCAQHLADVIAGASAALLPAQLGSAISVNRLQLAANL